MAAEDKPRINITRGKRTSSRSTSPSKKEERSASQAIPDGLGDLAGRVTGGVRDVWLAGLGALSVVEEQGSKAFRTLVDEGKAWEQKRREEAKTLAEEARTQQEQARETLDEQVVHRVRAGLDAALERFGVPSQATLDELHAQIEELNKKANRLAAALDEQAQDEERAGGRT